MMSIYSAHVLVYMEDVGFALYTCVQLAYHEISTVYSVYCEQDACHSHLTSHLHVQSR